MRIALTSVALIGTLAFTAPCLAGGATFKLLETHSTHDVTVDEFGRTLVLTGGSMFSGLGDQFIYDVDGDAYTYIGGPAWGERLSADGTTVVGSQQAVDVWVEAVKWTVGGGSEFLGGLEGLCDSSRSRAYGVSGDGSVVVGLANNADCSSVGSVWTAEEGMQPLEHLNADHSPQYNRATVVSDDGQVIAGFAQGTYNRTPAVWNAADRSGFLLDVDAEGEFTSISPDGRILAGRYFDETMVGIYPGFMPFYWTEEDGVVILPIVDGTDGGFVRGVSASGRTFVGSTGGGLPVNAMVIRPEWGAVLLHEKLIELGVTIPDDVTLVNAWAVSDDGTVVVGYAAAPVGEIIAPRGFVATLPEEQPVLCNEDLDGDGQIGFTDLTQLLGTWGPCAACPEDFDGDGQVGFTDLTQLLGSWGPC